MDFGINIRLANLSELGINRLTTAQYKFSLKITYLCFSISVLKIRCTCKRNSWSPQFCSFQLIDT